MLFPHVYSHSESLIYYKIPFQLTNFYNITSNSRSIGLCSHTLRDTWKVEISDGPEMKIKGDIDDPEMEIKDDILDHEYRIEVEEKQIAEI